MRKRNIKSIAHWVIMSVLLLFPVLMVGVSAFANDEQTTTVNTTYEYQTNTVNSGNDIVLYDNIYKCYLSSLVNDFFTNDSMQNPDNYVEINIVVNDAFTFDIGNMTFNGDDLEGDTDYSILSLVTDNGEDCAYSFNVNDYVFYYSFPIGDGSDCIYDNGSGLNYVYCTITSLTFDNYFLVQNYFIESDYLGEATTTVDIQNSNYKQEVNNWANGFKNLPVNLWYGNLLDAIGVGATTNSVMNVIYVYPLYVLWVYILDLIVDCLLLIINFGHNALKRLGGDNE